MQQALSTSHKKILDPLGACVIGQEKDKSTFSYYSTNTVWQVLKTDNWKTWEIINITALAICMIHSHAIFPLLITHKMAIRQVLNALM